MSTKAVMKVSLAVDTMEFSKELNSAVLKENLSAAWKVPLTASNSAFQSEIDLAES